MDNKQKCLNTELLNEIILKMLLSDFFGFLYTENYNLSNGSNYMN